jgi:hypothetical protein
MEIGSVVYVLQMSPYNIYSLTAIMINSYGELFMFPLI